ncbi:MAG: hypothetical protein M3Z09_12650 [Acidobacteriota bacterium]|nr:hypothetical protein [Acidobacteriota bacterium]
MICPRCRISYDPDEWEACPQCDEGEETECSGVLKTSTILISAGDEKPEVYRSMEEVPEPLRGMLMRSTSGLNSGIIFIADQRGREQIANAVHRLPQPPPAAPPDRWATAFTTAIPPAAAGRRRSRVSLPALLLAVLALAFAAGTGWLVGGRAW